MTRIGIGWTQTTYHALEVDVDEVRTMLASTVRQTSARNELLDEIETASAERLGDLVLEVPNKGHMYNGHTLVEWLDAHAQAGDSTADTGDAVVAEVTYDEAG